MDAGRKEAVQAMAVQRYPPVPQHLRAVPRSAVIGGSGVMVAGKERYSVETPFGLVVNASFLDDAGQVLFLNRHLCTHVDEATGDVRYAPPHEVNYQAMVWSLHELSVRRVVALSSTGSLAPQDIPVGSVVMPDDYYMVKPDPISFWPHPALGTFEADPSQGKVGRIHFAPAIPEDTAWCKFRGEVQQMLVPVLNSTVGQQIKLCRHQTKEGWPCFGSSPTGTPQQPPLHTVYVNTVGPRFETRAEIRSYRDLGGSVVGMTCGYEWTLCSELLIPYVLLSVVDNACNGLSTYPGGALKEYLDHKSHIGDVTTAIVEALVAGLTATRAGG